MKTLILYETRHGASKKVAEILGERIENSVVAKLSNFFGRLNKYDRVIVGGPIYVGKLNPRVKKYIAQNSDWIDAVFVSGMLHMNAEKEVEKNLPADFIKNKQVEFVGGAFNWDKMNFIEKFIVKHVTKSKGNKDEFIYENIEKLIPKEEA